MNEATIPRWCASFPFHGLIDLTSHCAYTVRMPHKKTPVTPSKRKTKSSNGQHAEPSPPIEIIPGVEVVSGQLSDFTPDPQNINDHTPRGHSMLTDQVQRNGVGRPIFATRDGVIKAGNLTGEVMSEVLDNPRAIVVRSHGDVAIIHQRMDIDSNDQRAVEMGLADNWVASVSLNLSPAAIAALDPTIRDRLMFKEEVALLLRGRDDLLSWQPLPPVAGMDDPEAYGDLHITVHELDQIEAVKVGLAALFKRHPQWKAEVR
jgi:hypothetical protein